MRPMGFSTGSLAKGDFQTALQILRPFRLDAIEMSALRETELETLLSAMETLDLSPYQHVSLHAPSQLKSMTEAELVQRLLSFAKTRRPIIVHPDMITNFQLWKQLGASLCIENMDKRKPIGRTSEELTLIFQNLPDATLCLDVGHARQVDPSMYETRQILKFHGHRLAEIHLSEVNCASGHEPLSLLAVRAFQTIAPLLPEHIPIILESPVTTDLIAQEIRLAQEALPSKELVPV